jgi:hypothetical protein
MTKKRDALEETIRSSFEDICNGPEVRDKPELQNLLSIPGAKEALTDYFARSRVLRAIYIRRAAPKKSFMSDATFLMRLAYGIGYDWAYNNLARRRPDAPPRLAERLLTLLVPASRLEEKLGDLEEAYRLIAQRQGEAFATAWYWREVFLCAVSGVARLGWFVARLLDLFHELHL